jgi:hypothetical protein
MKELRGKCRAFYFTVGGTYTYAMSKRVKALCVKIKCMRVFVHPSAGIASATAPC